MKRLIFLVFLLTGTSQLSAQNYLFRPSESGSFISGNIGSGNKMLQTGVTLGYSLNGKLDLSVSGIRANGNGAPGFYSISPAISYMFIKQKEIPFSVVGNLAYRFKKFPLIKGLEHNSAQFGLGLFHRTDFNDRFSVIPGIFAGLDLTKASVSLEDKKLSSYEMRVQTSVLIGLFSITPSLTYVYEKYLTSCSLGFIIPSPKRIKPIN